MDTSLARPWGFFAHYFSNLRQVGAIAPSSRQLAHAVGALAQGRSRIVELGPGTGSLSQALLEVLPPEGRMLAFEVDAGFRNHLRTRFEDPRFRVTSRRAQRLLSELQEQAWGAPDCIVSGLPFQAFPRQQTLRILLECRRSLGPGGRFIAFQYAPTLWPLFRKVFPRVRVAGLVLQNLPPAFLLVADL